MFSDFVILDNFFEDPFSIIKVSKNLSYEKNLVELDESFNSKNYNLKNCNWRGYRSQSLHSINNNLFNSIFNSLFNKLLPQDWSFTYKICSYFHFLPSLVGNDFESWWHTDESLYAGLIFLSENPANRSGTILKINDDEIIIENKFNRLLLYKSNIFHRPESGFGKNIDNSRLTITFFIDSLSFSCQSH